MPPAVSGARTSAEKAFMPQLKASNVHEIDSAFLPPGTSRTGSRNSTACAKPTVNQFTFRMNARRGRGVAENLRLADALAAALELDRLGQGCVAKLHIFLP